MCLVLSGSVPHFDIALLPNSANHNDFALTVRYFSLFISICSFVFVIGLHAVQFGNNWIRKILWTAKIGRGRTHSPIWQSEEFFVSNHFQIGQACSTVTY